MPLPNLAALHAGPDSLLTWLDSNILTAGTVTDVPNPPGTAWVRIVQRPPIAPGMPIVGQDANGAAADVYQLQCDGGGAHDAVRAYICNYTAGQHRSVQVGNAADFCFTINLNGCTFGVGAAAANGTRTVTHANTGGNIPQQRQQIRNAQGVGANMGGVGLLEPSLYRNIGGQGQHQATVFGIRSGLNWRFYFQSYTYLGNQTFRLNGVFPIPGG